MSGDTDNADAVVLTRRRDDDRVHEWSGRRSRHCSTGQGPAGPSRAETTMAGRVADTTGRLAKVHELPDATTGRDGLTARQRLVLETIRTSVEQRGYPPSMREIGEAVGLTSPSSVKHQLTTLERKGYLRRDPNRPRAIEVVQSDDSRESARCPAAGSPGRGRGNVRRGLARASHAVLRPVVGRIAAGGPSSPSRSWRTSSRSPSARRGRRAVPPARGGDSMIDAAICDGDWVVVRRQPVAENGEIVAAMIDGEATVKTFKRIDKHVWLMPHNEAYSPISGDDAQVLGRVVSVLRSL
ncbi:transcriptional repressor LexA [Oerskovia sp. M15]